MFERLNLVSCYTQQAVNAIVREGIWLAGDIDEHGPQHGQGDGQKQMKQGARPIWV